VGFSSEERDLPVGVPLLAGQGSFLCELHHHFGVHRNGSGVDKVPRAVHVCSENLPCQVGFNLCHGSRNQTRIFEVFRKHTIYGAPASNFQKISYNFKMKNYRGVFCENEK
jgi:hypothetical protein